MKQCTVFMQTVTTQQEPRDAWSLRFAWDVCSLHESKQLHIDYCNTLTFLNSPVKSTQSPFIQQEAARWQLQWLGHRQT